MENMIKYQIGEMASDLGKAGNFIRFIELEERKGINLQPDFTKGIIAKNISFTYPNADKPSIDNVSLIINAGETIAIVGENGSGKTTLVKMLIGSYIPAKGQIYLNGMNTADTNEESIFNGVSGVFQHYQRYQMTLEENVNISDSKTFGNVETALKKAGVNMRGESFPSECNTMLSREFGGVEVSGGE